MYILWTAVLYILLTDGSVDSTGKGGDNQAMNEPKEPSKHFSTGETAQIQKDVTVIMWDIKEISEI